MHIEPPKISEPACKAFACYKLKTSSLISDPWFLSLSAPMEKIDRLKYIRKCKFFIT